MKKHFTNIDITDVPLCLIKNGSVRNIISSIYSTINANKIINIVANYYKNNPTDDIFNTQYAKLLEEMFVHGYVSSGADYYFNLLKELYAKNENNLDIVKIYSRCLEYGYFKTAKASFYYKELYNIYKKYEQDEVVTKYYARLIEIAISNNTDNAFLPDYVKILGEVYQKHKSTAGVYSNALSLLLHKADYAELKQNILSKLHTICIENPHFYDLPWNYAQAYYHYISYDLTEQQREKFIVNDFCSKGIYKTTTISFPRNYLVLEYDAEFDDDEGSSFSETLEIYIFTPDAIIKINNELKNKIQKPDYIKLLEKMKKYYLNLSNDNTKDIFLYFISIYDEGKENKDPFDFLNLFENIPYIYARWGR